ncbi:MAG: FAD-binding oxidoreductase [Pseudomonadota bacterium]
MDLHRAVEDWKTLLGPSRVVLGDAAIAAYGADVSGSNRDLPAALQIHDAGLLPEVMRIAWRHRVSVYPISTGRNWGYGSALPVRDGCVIIDLSALRKVLHFDAELGVVTVEPGVTQGQLAEFLDAGGHPYMVPVTGAGPTCSLLGNALERGYGITPHTDHFGAVTDLEAVLADGSRYRGALHEVGGEDLARLFKWGIGPYCAGLFTQGGFGIVTRMSILLARRPEAIQACLFSLRDDALLEPAVERIRDVLGALPGTVGAINLMNQHRVLAMAAPFPADQLGADGLIPPALLRALGRQYQVQPWTGFATLYGTRRVVAAARKEIRQRLAGVANRLLFVSPERARRLAAVVARWPGAAGQRLARTASTLAQSLELVSGRPNETALPLAYWLKPDAPRGRWRDPSRDGCGLIWYAPLVPMRPAGVRAYTDMVHHVTRQHRIEPLITLTSIGDKLFDSTVPLLFDRDQPDAVGAARRCFDALFARGRALGCAPYRVGIDHMDQLRALQTDASAFHDRLRSSVDPHGVLMPGRYG